MYKNERKILTVLGIVGSFFLCDLLIPLHRLTTRWMILWTRRCSVGVDNTRTQGGCERLVGQEERPLGGSWEMNTPEAVSKTSATAYYFADMLEQTLGIPVGPFRSDDWDDIKR